MGKPRNKFFISGWKGYFWKMPKANRTENEGPSQNDTENIFNQIIKYFDWIGTTEWLSNDTLPILRKFNPSINHTYTSSNIANHSLYGFIHKSMISEKSLNYLKSITRRDNMLYHNLIEHYGSKCFRT